MRKQFFVILFLAAAALVIGPIRTGRPEASRIPSMEPNAQISGEFVAGGFYPGVSTSNLPKNIEIRGSWVDGDAFMGTCATPWYAPARKINLMVSGYPRKPGNKLEIEVQRPSNLPLTIAFAEDDPGELWREWCVALPEDTRAFRIIAQDHSIEAQGWLAFSEPFFGLHFPGWKNVCRFAQLLTTTCLAMCLLYGPGLCWALYWPQRPTRWIESILPGPLCLAGIGMIIWALGGLVPPVLVARATLIIMLSAISFAGFKLTANKEAAFSKTAFQPVLLLSVFVCALAVSKSALSIGPEGELYRGSISRTLSPSGHSDSRISYHLVQVVAHHLSPASPQTANYYAPWRLTSRGPLAGLIASPLVIGCGSTVPLEMPDQDWSPYDREGFTIYRITMIVLGSLAMWAVFGTLAAIATEAGALFGVLLLAIAPFFVHELFFTWPKLIAASQVLLALVAIEKRSYFGAGLALGIGYLYHPLASLSVPFLLVWTLCRTRPWNYRAALFGATALVSGVMLLILPWAFLDHLLARDANAQSGQRLFLGYFFSADNHAATFATWIRSRWHNLSYTFLPFWFFNADFSHESLNSIYKISNRWVHYSFVYWNTLPFALGLPAFITVFYSTLAAARRHLAVAAVLLIGPALFLVVYWGAADTGLMRHCGHVIFLSIVCFVGWSLSLPQDRVGIRFISLFLHPLLFVVRLADLAFVCLGTSLLHHLPQPEDVFFINDAVLLGVCLCCLVMIFFVLARLRDRLLQPSVLVRRNETAALKL